MSKIKVTSKCKIYDGMSITFKAPCDCTAVDGLNVHYQGVTHYFSLRDAHGNDLAGVRNLFTAGTYVKVILDTASGIAYIQNADSNAYLENRLDNILKDETKSQFGLDADAVPDDAFSLLSRYQSGLGNEYLWEKTTVEAIYDIIEDTTNKAVFFVKDATSAAMSGNYNNYSTLTYGKSISVNENGEFVLGDIFTPTTVPSNTSNSQAYWNSLCPFYVRATVAEGIPVPNMLVKVVSRSTTVYCDYGVVMWAHYLSVSEPETVVTNYGYVNNPDPNAYPPAVSDGFTYNLLGQLGGAARIETGSYVGTGTWGANNPTSLTFSFAPKLVWFYSLSDGMAYQNSNFIHPYIYPDKLTTEYSHTTSPWFDTANYGEECWAKKSEDGKTFSWYIVFTGTASADFASAQLNTNQNTYHYIAFG